ncbi:MAG: type II toxin-antitoxin system RelE/ParE family toxin [Limnobaculum xujianqingii]|uniref:type II toxin-antitoxin system RelE/ParE family toxin n=1 Tax=Limnobaculum xujianqingii TaxID=2738837 RepID=UPI001127FFDA|nr:type II toxin-antitoxin system RelE/ParE family toxin [Limnobaculum xujianqingii]
MWVEWTEEAQEELWTIINYIDDRNSQAALHLYRDIITSAEMLLPYPYMHRQGRILGTREIVVHPNYIVVYRVTSCVEIISVLHARQEYP